MCSVVLVVSLVCLHCCPALCTYMHPCGLPYLCECLPYTHLLTCTCEPLTCLPIPADMDGNTNDPWWNQILSCFKAAGFRQYPRLAPECWSGRGRGFLSTSGFYGIYDPSPHQLSLPPLALLPLARISGRGKQTNYKETNTTANKHVVTWRKRFQQDACWEREREG